MVLTVVLNIFNTFSLGVVLRFLHCYLGSAFRAYIPSEFLRKPALREQVLRYGRLPPSVLKSCVRELKGIEDDIRGCGTCVMLDCEAGESVRSMAMESLDDVLVVVDERRELGVDRCRRVHALCTGFIHYDTISLIYALTLLKRLEAEKHGEETSTLTAFISCRAFRDLVYVVRKIRESLQTLGSDTLIDPTTLVSVLNKRLRERLLRAELRSMIIEKDWLSESMKQTIYMDVYSLKDLSYLCTLRAIFREGHHLELDMPLDSECRAVETCVVDIFKELPSRVEECSRFFDLLQE